MSLQFLFCSLVGNIAARASVGKQSPCLRYHRIISLPNVNGSLELALLYFQRVASSVMPLPPLLVGPRMVSPPTGRFRSGLRATMAVLRRSAGGCWTLLRPHLP